MTSPIPTEGGTHRPGPWEIGDDGPIHYEGMLRPVWNIYGGQGLRDGRLVASVEHFKEDHYPNANARLIAAAPALLEALTDLVIYHDVPDECQDQVVKPLLKAAFAAIRQATGGEDVRR